jgi:cell division protein FtsL
MIPILLFATVLIAMLATTLHEGYARRKWLHEQLYEEIAKRHKVEDEYHELMLHTVSCRMLMWKNGVATPDLPPHLSKAKGAPRGLVN